MTISEKLIDNISFISINNESGISIVLCSLGASIFQLETTNHNGLMESVIVTPSNLNDFYYNKEYFGKTIGRFAGRIDNGKCIINDQEYILDKNWNNINSLHGGNNGISFVNFSYQINKKNDYYDVIFTFLEKENKLPGDVNYSITYRIYNKKNEFTIYFEAISNKDTIINLTNHTYFNLSGNARNTILNHKLKLYCDKYSKLDDNLIPISIEKVNKVMNFQHFKKIKKHINDDSLTKHIASGYDHCFVKKNEHKDTIAILKDRKSKRKLTIKTSYPSIVCYTCNYPAKYDFNAERIKILKHHAICFECQYVPNNNYLLKANEKFAHYINYQFDN